MSPAEIDVANLLRLVTDLRSQLAVALAEVDRLTAERDDRHRWRSVAEEPPPEGPWLLVRNDADCGVPPANPAVARREAGIWFESPTGHGVAWTPTHWLPLGGLHESPVLTEARRRLAEAESENARLRAWTVTADDLARLYDESIAALEARAVRAERELQCELGKPTVRDPDDFDGIDRIPVPKNALPDLDDPVTAAGLLPTARLALGEPTLHALPSTVDRYGDAEPIPRWHVERWHEGALRPRVGC